MASPALARVVFLLVLATLAESVVVNHVEKMYMESSAGSDSKPSATGYIYRSDNGSPGSYVYLGAGDIHRHFASHPGIVSEYVQHTPLASFTNGFETPSESAPILATPLKVKVEAAAAPYLEKVEESVDESGAAVSSEEDVDKYSAGFETVHYGSAGDHGYGLDDGSYGYGLGAGHGDYGYAGDHGYGFDHGFGLGGGNSYGGSFGHEQGYGVGGGHFGGGDNGGGYDHLGHGSQHGGEFSGDQQSAHGEKGSKGFKSYDGFGKGENGHNEKGGEQGHYSSGEGYKSGFGDQGSHYSDHFDAGHGSKGGSFGEKKGHKKGEETTGFHNVYNKDEFKKDHTFYDDADESGHFNKHGSSSANGGSSKGGYEKGEKHDGGYHEDENAKKVFSSKGYFDGDNKGYKSAEGYDAYAKHFQDFAKGAGTKGGSEYGFKH